MHRAGCEYFWVVVREGNVVDFLVVAGVPEFCGQLFGVEPINVWLCGGTKHIGVVVCKSDRSDSSQQLRFGDNSHWLDGHLCDCPIARPHDYVAVGQDPKGVDSKGEQFFYRAKPFIYALLNRDLIKISSLGADVAEVVVLVNGNALEDSLDVAKVDRVSEHFFVLLVDGNNLDFIVHNCDQFVIWFIEKLDLVHWVSEGVAVKGFARTDVPDDDRVFVVNSADWSQVELIEWKR